MIWDIILTETYSIFWQLTKKIVKIFKNFDDWSNGFKKIEHILKTKHNNYFYAMKKHCVEKKRKIKNFTLSFYAIEKNQR